MARSAQAAVPVGHDDVFDTHPSKRGEGLLVGGPGGAPCRVEAAPPHPSIQLSRTATAFSHCYSSHALLQLSHLMPHLKPFVDLSWTFRGPFLSHICWLYILLHQKSYTHSLMAPDLDTYAPTTSRNISMHHGCLTFECIACIPHTLGRLCGTLRLSHRPKQAVQHAQDRVLTGFRYGRLVSDRLASDRLTSDSLASDRLASKRLASDNRESVSLQLPLPTFHIQTALEAQDLHNKQASCSPVIASCCPRHHRCQSDGTGAGTRQATLECGQGQGWMPDAVHSVHERIAHETCQVARLHGVAISRPGVHGCR